MAVGLVLAGTATIAVMDALVKHVSQSYSVLQITWVRYAVQLGLLFALVPPRRSLRFLATRRPGLQLLRAALLLTASVAFFTAVHFIPLAQANAIAFAAPLLITALSVPLLGERVGRRRWAAVVVGLLGVLVIIRPTTAVMHWAMLMALVMACASALYHTTTPILGRTENPLGTLYFAAILGTCLGAAVLPFAWSSPAAVDWALMAAIGALGTAGHFLLILAFQKADASVLSPFLYFHLLWATALGFAFFDELPDTWTVAGAAMVVGAGLYVYSRERPSRRGLRARVSRRGRPA